jgi:hypothetical protein
MSESSDAPRDVFHVVVAPSSRLVSHAVLTLLENCDRKRWYPSMLVEGYDTDLENQQLALAARRLGVPVMSPRASRGEHQRDRTRTFLDEWFYIRNAHASLVHVHAGSPIPRWAPINWLKYVMPHLPVIESVYVAGDGDGTSGRAEIAGRGLAGSTTVPLSSMADTHTVSRLYEAIIAPSGSR